MQKENRKLQSRTIKKLGIAKRNEMKHNEQRTKIANKREFKKRERKKASYNCEANEQARSTKPTRHFKKNEVTSSFQAKYDRKTTKKGHNYPQKDYKNNLNSSNYNGTHYSKSREQEREGTVSILRRSKLQ